MEGGHAFADAAVPHVRDPDRVPAPVPGTTRTAGDDPREPVETELVPGPRHRLGADEATNSAGTWRNSSADLVNQPIAIADNQVTAVVPPPDVGPLFL